MFGARSYYFHTFCVFSERVILKKENNTKGRFRLCPCREEKRHFFDQTMLRGEAFGLKNYIKVIQCQISNILMKKNSASQRKFGSSILLERPNSWRHNFLKVLPPRLFLRRRPLDFGLGCEG